MSTLSMKRNQCFYDASFKIKVIEFAESNGNRAAGREYGVSQGRMLGTGESKKMNLLNFLRPKEPVED